MSLSNSMTDIVVRMSQAGDGGLSENVVKKIEENFVSIQGKVWAVTKNGIVPLSSADKVKGVVQGFIRDNFDFSLDKGDLELVSNTLLPLNDYVDIKYDKNILLDEVKIKFDRDRKTIYITNPLMMRKPTMNAMITDTMKNDVMADYHKHFPELNNILDFIVASNLSIDKKKTFLDLELYSDFGKTRFAVALENIGVAMAVDADIVYNKDASAISPTDILNSMVIYIEEFEDFTKAMKTLDNSISIAPKFGMATKIPLNAKIFLNATKSSSLSGAIGDEILNRVMLIEKKKGGKLGDLPSVKQYGTAIFPRILEDYCYNYILKTVNDYKDLGDEILSANEASRVLGRFYEEYKLSNSDSNVPLASLAKDTLIASLSNSIGNLKIERLENGEYLIATPKKTLLDIISNECDADEFKRLKGEFSTVENFLTLAGAKIGSYHYRNVNGRRQKARSITVSDFADHPLEVETMIEEPIPELFEEIIESEPTPTFNLFETPLEINKERTYDELLNDTLNYHNWTVIERKAYRDATESGVITVNNN